MWCRLKDNMKATIRELTLIKLVQRLAKSKLEKTMAENVKVSPRA